MMLLNVLLLFLAQTSVSVPNVIVGLVDGQKLVVESPQFSGFIETREPGEAFLLYRQDKFRGEVSLTSVARIDFGEYRRDQPFTLTLTLKSGQKLEVVSDRRDFVTVKGRTEIGTITVKHPDPISSEVRLSTSKPNRSDDLTILYLEFPAS
jgi:hypothetical protein